MNIKTIKLINFLSHSNTKISFNSNGIFLFLGENHEKNGDSNGAGKSSIVDAFLWCLYGESRYGKDLAKIVKLGESEVSVNIEFELNNIDYTIERRKKKDTSTELVCSAFQGTNLKDTQNYIEELLKLNSDTFKNSTCLLQGESDSFSKLSQKEAKDIILNILNVKEYDELEKKCKEKLHEDKNKLSELTPYITIFNTNSNELDNKIKIYNEKNNKLIETKQELQNIEHSINQNEIKLQEKQNLFNEKMKQLKDKHYALSQTLKIKIENAKDLLRNAQSLTKECPTCKQEVSKIYQQNLESCFESLLKSQKLELQRIEDNYTNKFNKLNLFYNTHITPILNTKNSYTSNYNSIYNIYNTLDKELYSLKNEINKLKENLSKIEQVKQNIEMLSKEIKIYGVLAETFGKNGIPSYIIENAIPELELIVNNIAQKINSELYIAFNITKQLKSGDTRDDFRISIRDSQGERPYCGYSGGEKFIIDFSIRVGLSILLTKRNKATIETLIIDEGLGSLDNAKIEKFLEILNYIQNNYGFKKIWLITHVQDLQSYFNNIIVIKKDDRGSYVD